MRTRTRKGSAIVELTLIAPLLTIMLLGTWHFGYAFYRYNALEQSVRAAGRFASVAQYKSKTSTPDSAFQTAVANVILYDDPLKRNNTTTLFPGLAAGMVHVTMHFDASAFPRPQEVEVSISGYTIPGAFSGVGWMSPLTLTNKPRVRFPYTGQWAPHL